MMSCDVFNLVGRQVAHGDRTVILTCRVLLSQLIIGLSLRWLTEQADRTTILTLVQR